MRLNHTGLRARTPFIAALAFAATAMAAPTPAPTPPSPAAADNEKDPAAMEALDHMGKYLQTLTAFQVRVTVQSEDVLDNGMKVQNSADTDLLARRPDGLRVDVTSDRQQRQLFFNGKEFTLWAPRTHFYATVPAPPTIGQLADVLAERFDIELPGHETFA